MGFGESLLYSITSVSNIYFWIESDYFDTAARVKPLLHTWSLSVEEQFYLIWPAVIWMFGRNGKRWLLPLLLFSTALTSLYLNFIFADGQVKAIDSLQVLLPVWLELRNWVSEGPSTIFYLLPFRVFEFAIGAGLVWVLRYSHDITNFYRELCVVIGLVLISYAVFNYDEDVVFPGAAALTPCFGAALCIFGGQAKYFGKLLSNPACVFVGLISYSLYLVHWPLVVLWQYYTFENLTVEGVIVVTLSSFILSILMYYYVERPFRKRKGRRDQGSLFPSSKIYLGLISGFLLFFCSLWIISSEGLSWRIGKVDYKELSSPPLEEVFLPGLDNETPWTHVYELGSRSQNATKVLVLGDSHAAQLKAGAEYLSLKYDLLFTFYTFTGCPPVFGTYKVYGAPRSIKKENRKQIQCRKQTEKWEKFVANNHFDYVILSSRWNWLFESTEYYDTKQRRDLLVDRNNPVFSVEASRHVFEQYLNRTIQTIQESGAEAIVFGQVPHIGKDIQGCNDIPKVFFNDKDIELRCNHIPMKYVLGRSEFSNRVIRKVASENGAVSVIPTDYFCQGGEYCQTLFKGIRLKDDDDHVNSYGAVFLIKHWEESSDFPFKSLSKSFDYSD